MKVKVISLPYIFQVLYILCFSRPKYQVSVYRTIGPLVCLSDGYAYIDILFILVSCKLINDTFPLRTDLVYARHARTFYVECRSYFVYETNILVIAFLINLIDIPLQFIAFIYCFMHAAKFAGF